MSTTVSTRKPGFPFHRLMRDGVYVAVFNFICGLVVTYLISDGTHLAQNMLISYCIGTVAFLLIDGTRLALWGESGRPNWLTFAVLLAVAVPAAQYAGARLAGWLLGYRLDKLYTLGSPNTTISLVITLLATGAATLFFANRDRILRAEAELALEKARTETVARQALQAQLQSLQAQIEPHMLFNTLANLQGLIAIDPPRAQEMLDLLIQYLRATLTSSRAETNTLAQEFELMKAYLGLMRIRMGERLSYSFELPKELRNATVPPMLLQPLVENAIAHGLEPKVAGGHVAVSAQLRDGVLVLAVRDDGRGPDAGPGKKGTNLGLSNIRERLRAMYGERAALTLEAAAPEGAVARITLPA
ncbi:sensor histidine kinase [Pseudoduganella namucuonensis]|uniref:Signal transduction histidine kinase n=1 Tax=Pseudoduganella namucuonensis TaxID=1035707 RepID=A0A1I7LBN1_9BURK|nr:histidine kinase [Pseudoduganella namucuonensis]SFV07133.1 signal transduction histidine kinase [Pseudoduganella namucuonensis]